MISAWLKDEKISSAQVASFQQKLDFFERGGPELVPNFITDTPIAPHIYKMKIKGAVQLRPLVCKGPFDLSSEYTMLVGWIERDNQPVPNLQKQRAQDNRKIVLGDPRRRVYERLS